MTTEVKTEKKASEEKTSPWLPAERESSKEKYGCEFIVENGSYKDVSTKKSPTDAYIIKYHHDDKVCFDLTRGTKINLFDMYWDKFKNGLKSIDYGNGTIKPNLWGYSPTPPKKKRK